MHGPATNIVSRRAQAADRTFAAVGEFYFSSRYGEKRGDAGIADFTFGNPHEMPLQGIVDSLRQAAVPQDKNWFAYKSNEPEAQQLLAEYLSRELGLDFAPEDFALTAGAFGAISLCFRILLDAGDEAIFSEPAWFCYEPTLLAADAVPVKVPLREPDFELDVAAIEAAVTERTRLVIVNTPHNPTGRIYSEATLRELAAALDRASARIGHRIFLLSDEPYRRLRFDGRGFTSPAAIYPWTLIDYSYGKVLLAPGQRLGYLALSPLMPQADREALRSVMFSVQMSLGWCFPNALMQHAIPDLERLSIDQAALTRRRDALVSALREAGGEVLEPEGTFYLWARWSGDPERQWDALADHDVYVMPGSILGAPNYFRVSLTASDAMVAMALPAFRQVLAG
jgi:aspartate aminotransferase